MTADELDRLEEDFKKLRIEYEKYFAGVERLEPTKDRDAFKKRLRDLMTTRTPNTARRFRMQGLQATLVTHEQYWTRITRQIEEGTYRRDKMRAEKLAAAEDAAPPPPKPAAPAPAPAAPGAANPLAALHAEYTTARKSLGQAELSLDALARTVAKQTAEIKAKYKCETVEFKVAVKDGKVILRALPK
jgi:hypothetical protein